MLFSFKLMFFGRLIFHNYLGYRYMFGNKQNISIRFWTYVLSLLFSLSRSFPACKSRDNTGNTWICYTSASFTRNAKSNAASRIYICARINLMCSNLLWRYDSVKQWK